MGVAGLRCRGDRGTSTTAVVLVMPVVLFAVMLVVQFALAYHARQILTAAAQDAAFAASAARAGPDSAQDAADRVLQLAADGLIGDVEVSVESTSEHVRVVIDGSVANVVPGLTFAVSGVGESPTERFRPQLEGSP